MYRYYKMYRYYNRSIEEHDQAAFYTDMDRALKWPIKQFLSVSVSAVLASALITFTASAVLASALTAFAASTVLASAFTSFAASTMLTAAFTALAVLSSVPRVYLGMGRPAGKRFFRRGKAHVGHFTRSEIDGSRGTEFCAVGKVHFDPHAAQVSIGSVRHRPDEGIGGRIVTQNEAGAFPDEIIGLVQGQGVSGFFALVTSGFPAFAFSTFATLTSVLSQFPFGRTLSCAHLRRFAVLLGPYRFHLRRIGRGPVLSRVT